MVDFVLVHELECEGQIIERLLILLSTELVDVGGEGEFVDADDVLLRSP
jgi:hypothetical protein